MYTPRAGALPALLACWPAGGGARSAARCWQAAGGGLGPCDPSLIKRHDRRRGGHSGLPGVPVTPLSLSDIIAEEGATWGGPGWAVGSYGPALLACCGWQAAQAGPELATATRWLAAWVKIPRGAKRVVREGDSRAELQLPNVVTPPVSPDLLYRFESCHLAPDGEVPSARV